jgi:AcrR family transcriptional regulator
VPKLWSETIDAHRREVRDAIVDTTAALVAAHGLRGVTMSQIADETGIGRATLYKYFADVEAILLAWHDREVGTHLRLLTRLYNEDASPVARLEAVLKAYAEAVYSRRAHHETEVAAFLHRHEHVAGAERRLRHIIRDLIAEGAENGELRNDVPPEELAIYCLHALAAATRLPSKAAVRRLVAVTLAAVRTPAA